MKQFVIIGGLLLSVLFSACEKVVDIPLDQADDQIVVEAVGKSIVGGSYVLLSKTINSNDAAISVEKLSDATVQISDNSGNVFVFEESLDQQGKYTHPSFFTMPNTVYNLSVNYQGSTVTAVSKSKTTPQIDSLFIFQNIGGAAGVEDTTNILIYIVTDNPDEKNFYRFVLWVNGEKESTIFIETDDLGNGETYTSPFFGISFESGDDIYAELWSMEKENYAYFSALFSNLNQSPFSAAPADPPTNIQNGLGYFGAFMVDTMSVSVP